MKAYRSLASNHTGASTAAIVLVPTLPVTQFLALQERHRYAPPLPIIADIEDIWSSASGRFHVKCARHHCKAQVDSHYTSQCMPVHARAVNIYESIMGLENVQHVLLILSGKGGVGKSSTTIQLALSLSRQGHNVGILDIDLTGPSIPRLLHLEDKKVKQAPGGWLPVQVHDTVEESHGKPDEHGSTSHRRRKRGSLHALSLGFLLQSRESAVIWRGPKKTAMIRQFVSDVLWPAQTDYLLIDTPPGTSDEHIAIVEELHKLASVTGQDASNGVTSRLAGAVVVTTPQAISTSDVRKELNFCTKTQVSVLGVIENMAGYMCPCCGEISNIFSKGGGEVMARECGVPFLGSVPVDTTFGSLVEGAQPAVPPEQAVDSGVSPPLQSDHSLLVERYATCGLSPIFTDFARGIDTALQGRQTTA